MGSMEPFILGSINPSSNALLISGSSNHSNRSDQILVYASGSIINVLEQSSLKLLQLINISQHLPKSDHLKDHTIDALHLTQNNRKLVVTSGPDVLIFTKTTPPILGSWSLHSSFTTYISKILSVTVKESYLVAGGHDGISLHQLKGDDSLVDSSLDGPPRWIRLMLIRQGCDQVDLITLKDGVVHIAALKLNLPFLKIYEYSSLETGTLAVSASARKDSLRSQDIALASPARSISLSQENVSPQSISGVTGDGKAVVNGRRYVHSGTCALPGSIRSPRAIAAFPLEGTSLSVLAKCGLIPTSCLQISVVLQSTGDVDLARTFDGRTTLSKCQTLPRLSPQLIRMLHDPLVIFNCATSISDPNSHHSPFFTCFIVARPLKPAGQVFFIRLVLDSLVSNSRAATLPDSELIEIHKKPFGFPTPNQPIALSDKSAKHYRGVFITQDLVETTKFELCVSDEKLDQPPSYLELFASSVVQGDLREKAPTTALRATGTWKLDKPAYCPIDMISNSLKNSNFREIGLDELRSKDECLGVYVSYQNGSFKTTLRKVYSQKVYLKGFQTDENPVKLMIRRKSKSDDLAEKIQLSLDDELVCITSLGRLLIWSFSEGIDSVKTSTERSADSLDMYLGSKLSDTINLTMSQDRSSSLIIWALDREHKLTQNTIDLLPKSETADLQSSSWVSKSISSFGHLIDSESCEKSLIIESQDSRNIAVLYEIDRKDEKRRFKLIIMDLRQKPYSPGILGNETIEVDDLISENFTPQMTWSAHQGIEYSHLGPTSHCFLAVTSGGDSVIIYCRDLDGWWTKFKKVNSNGLGAVSRVSWISSPDNLQLIYEVEGHQFISSAIQTLPRREQPIWNPAYINSLLTCGETQLSITIVACLSLALRGDPDALAELCNILAYSIEDESFLYDQILKKYGEKFATFETDQVIKLTASDVEIISKAAAHDRIPLLSLQDQKNLKQLAKHLLQIQTLNLHGVDIIGQGYSLSLLRYLDRSTRPGNDMGFESTQDSGIILACNSPNRNLLAQETVSILENYKSNPDSEGRKLSWRNARGVGLFLWLQAEEVQPYVETVAKIEFVGECHGSMTQSGNDPCSCSIFYMALRKKRLLQGLWKMAYGHSDRPLMLKFLENDFSMPRWKTAAQKNAYALISRQRFSFAASFFLLADRLQDAVNVCVRQLNDWQLGVAIARAYEGDRGPVLEKVLNDFIIPKGFAEGNRWLLSWGFKMLGQFDLSRRSLVVPLEELVESFNPKTQIETDYIRIGPLDLRLILAYNRDFNNLSKSPLSWEEEKRIILLCTEELRNSGCDRSVIRFLRNWKVSSSRNNLSGGNNTTEIAHRLSNNVNNQLSFSSTKNTGAKDSNDDEGCLLIEKEEKVMVTGISGGDEQGLNSDCKALDDGNSTKKRVLSKNVVVPEFDMSNFF
ncbi:RAVE protein 1 C terminal-domain-containing protein [Phakopsora pachyrhizi]|uniref:RAVE protein 1 C terminal-domain-containing protein n=1 Tax=Phakopsora pachyrhizi TaxID=170000 RepID=A0AAV0BNX5_PHAPC|nr:RAVE protein 1 C terminal-domain-containing protein [Phakopsora pachyrhizi]